MPNATTGIDFVSFLGAGAYRHYVPPVIGTLAMRGEFLTAYTPYQAEVSQGYLQAIYEWQTYICLLTGMDLANASVYDGATALAEGAIMAVNATGRQAVLVSRAVHPNYRAVLHTYARRARPDRRRAAGTPPTGRPTSARSTRCSARRSTPRSSCSRRTFSARSTCRRTRRAQAVEDSGTRADRRRRRGDVAGARSRRRRQWGAHIVVGEGQSFGVPLAYGGPYVGFIAATKEHMRRIPGRLVGRTVDADGEPAFMLTLQAREQHIRREKATSNICTNQAHCALIATIYLAAIGETGLRRLSPRSTSSARTRLAERVAQVPRLHAALRGAGLQRVRRSACRPA